MLERGAISTYARASRRRRRRSATDRLTRAVRTRGGMTMMHTLSPTAELGDRHRRCRPAGDPGRRAHRRSASSTAGSPTSTPRRCASLYRDMVLVRRIDTEGVALQRQGQLGLWAPCQGQEATQVGTARAFRSDDFVFPSYREIGVNFVRGANACRLRARLARRGALDATTRTTSTPRRRRSSSARRRCTPSATRWASSSTAPTRSPPRTSATAPPARAM